MYNTHILIVIFIINMAFKYFQRKRLIIINKKDLVKKNYKEKLIIS